MSHRSLSVRSFAIVAFAVGNFMGAIPSYAQSSSTECRQTSAFQIAGTLLDENGELEAVDPSQAPIYINDDPKVAAPEYSGSWNSVVTSRLDGPGPLPPPRPLSSIISGLQPANPDLDIQGFEAVEGGDTSDFRDAVPAASNSRPRAPRTTPALLFEPVKAGGMG